MTRAVMTSRSEAALTTILLRPPPRRLMARDCRSLLLRRPYQQPQPCLRTLHLPHMRASQMRVSQILQVVGPRSDLCPLRQVAYPALPPCHRHPHTIKATSPLTVVLANAMPRTHFRQSLAVCYRPGRTQQAHLQVRKTRPGRLWCQRKRMSDLRPATLLALPAL